MRWFIKSSLAFAFTASASFAGPFEPSAGTIVLASSPEGCPINWIVGEALWVQTEAPNVEESAEYISSGDEVIGLVHLRLFPCFYSEEN
jgi:hypothetical protein